MRKLVRRTLLVAALLAGPVRAHEGGTHARGVVKEISGERIVLTTSEGKPLTIALGPETRIIRGNEAVSVEAVRPGERAVVHARRKAGQLEATHVKLGSAKKPP